MCPNFSAFLKLLEIRLDTGTNYLESSKSSSKLIFHAVSDIFGGVQEYIYLNVLSILNIWAANKTVSRSELCGQRSPVRPTQFVTE